MTRAFSHGPEVLDAWGGLILSIRERMDRRRYELVAVAAAERLGSSYCMLAHGSYLASTFYDEESVVGIVWNRGAADLGETDLAVMGLAEKVAGDALSVTQEDVDRLKRLGLSDAEIFEVAFTAAYFNYTNRVAEGLGVEAEPE